jgi:OTU domain-containing protein 5
MQVDQDMGSSSVTVAESALTSATSDQMLISSCSTSSSGSLNSSDASATQSEASVANNNNNNNSNISNSPPASPTGYNSGDEYGGRPAHAAWTPEQLNEMERRFEKKLRKKGLKIMKMGEDGACLFRAVADQVYGKSGVSAIRADTLLYMLLKALLFPDDLYSFPPLILQLHSNVTGDEEMHALVRKLCCDYMTKNSDYFSQYVTEEVPQYVARKRRDNIQGNHVELQALSELFARPIEVYHYNSEPINIFQSGQEEDMLPDDEDDAIRLSYHTTSPFDSGHYNSVRTLRGTFKPKATLLQFTPPHVMESAIRTSEADALEKAMLEDKIRATDWEATSEALEEQVARESYLEWLRENERRRQLSGASGLTTSSSTVTAPTEIPAGNRSPQAGGSSQHQEGQSCRQNWTTCQGLRVPFPGSESNDAPVSHQPEPSVSYFDQVPDDAAEERQILARVMLASRQEYLDSLKARNSPTSGVNRSPNPKSGSTTRGSTPPPSSSRQIHTESHASTF